LQREGDLLVGGGHLVKGCLLELLRRHIQPHILFRYVSDSFHRYDVHLLVPGQTLPQDQMRDSNIPWFNDQMIKSADGATIPVMDRQTTLQHDLLILNTDTNTTQDPGFSPPNRI